MSLGSKQRPHHQLTSQLEFDFTLGPIKIKDGLFMGDELAAKDIEFILTNKVTHIVNTVCRRIPNLWEKVGVQYLQYNWADNQQNVFDKKNATVNGLFNFIEEAMVEGRSCLVHSVNCKSRAFTVVAAYLIKRYSWSLEKTLDFVKLKKPELRVKQTFLLQLKDLEMRLSKGNGFTSDWKVSQNQEDLVLSNTYLNTHIPLDQQSGTTGTKKGNRKKVSWLESEARLNNKYSAERRGLPVPAKQPLPVQNPDQEPRPLKSILKNSTQMVPQQKEQPVQRPIAQQRQPVVNKPPESVTSTIMNNFMGTQEGQPDRLSSTTKKELIPNTVLKPHLTRPFSSDAKQRDKRIKESKQPKFAVYDAMTNFKSPYEQNIIQSKLARGLKPPGPAKKEEEAYKPMALFERPHSASSTQKRKVVHKGLLQEAKRCTHMQNTEESGKPNSIGMLSRKQQETYNPLTGYNYNGYN